MIIDKNPIYRLNLVPLQRYPYNIRLTCICAFANAKRKAKLARKLHKKGAALAATAQATFVPKQMSALKRVLDFYLILSS